MNLPRSGPVLRSLLILTLMACGDDGSVSTPGADAGSGSGAPGGSTAGSSAGTGTAGAGGDAGSGGPDSGTGGSGGGGTSGTAGSDAGMPQAPPSGVPEWDADSFDTVHDVGPGQTFAEIGEVPWESLGDSTLVRIHGRAEPYRSKWVLNTVASEQRPLVVLGVPDSGQVPVVTGVNATTREELSYWNEPRSIIKVGGSNLPSDDLTPAWITIQGLEIHGALPGDSFTDDSGASDNFADNAAAVHVERGDHISIVDCDIHHAGNGIFSGSGSSNLAVRHNYVHDNGIPDSIYQHNSYTESRGILFEFNRYGPPCPTCPGNNLKDRSAGTVIRYNWIEGGNRQLDLVETDFDEIRDDPSYRTTFVYGNLLIEPDGAGNSQIVHYGGDGGDEGMYRKGTLHFFHNTLVSTRVGNTTLLRLSTNDESADVRNNVLSVTAGGSSLAITGGSGAATLMRNCLPGDHVDSHDTLEGSVTESGSVEVDSPGFVDAAGPNFALSAESLCRGGAGDAAAGSESHPVESQYVRHRGVERRTNTADPGALYAR